MEILFIVFMLAIVVFAMASPMFKISDGSIGKRLLYTTVFVIIVIAVMSYLYA